MAASETETEKDKRPVVELSKIRQSLNGPLKTDMREPCERLSETVLSGGGRAHTVH